ncbi:MAG TPA: hypothetical protein VNZ52_12535, partial [Candidatus Thermoplasmatota archaeon]|nr:hypothetical protein [Candidatus Thermoplasmatota archaeon]
AASPASFGAQAPAAEARANAPAGYARPTYYERDIIRHTRGKLAGDVTATLEYVPSYAFEYQCGYRASPEIRNPPAPLKGTVVVNAYTGEAAEGNVPEVSPQMPQQGTALPGKLDASAARDKALSQALKNGTKDVNAVQNKAGTMWVEKRKISPLAEDAMLTPRGSFYLPVWKLEGSNGWMRVNAVTNTVAEENFEPIPAGRDAEFV